MSDIEETRRLYEQVFAAETDRMPMIVSPPCPGMPAGREMATDPVGYVRRVAEALAPKVEAGGDWIPVAPFVWHQCVAIPSLYGARIVDVPGSVPVPEPLFASTVDAARAIPADSSALVDEMMDALDASLNALPDGFALAVSYTSSPFDLAQMLVSGGTFATDMLCEPQACQDFLSALTDAAVAMVRRMRERTDTARDDGITTWGMAFRGLRLPSDALVNFSPDLLRRFALPVLDRLGREFGPLCIHYCTQPAPSGHVLGPLSECPAVRIADTHQGYDAFLGPACPARMQDRVAVVFKTNLRTEEAMRRLLESEPVRGVPRKGGRAIVVHTGADSVDDARRIYERWGDLSR